jgi:hypothetical protein
MNVFMNGAIAMACVAVGVFFLKFWKRTYDRLFGLFAIAFWLLASDRLVITIIGQSETSSAAQYSLRLAAFLVIILGIVDKNRRPSP